MAPGADRRRSLEVAVLLLWMASCSRHAADLSARPQAGPLSNSTAAGSEIEGDGRAGAHADDDANAGEHASAPSPAGAGDRAARSRWRGTYHSESGGVFVPPDWKGVKWSVPSTSAGLGEGAIALDVGGSRVSGELEGPLGPATIDGVVSGATITATILRRDPADRGYSGTLIATLADRGVTGSMNLSLGEASAVRTATFSLSRAP